MGVIFSTETTAKALAQDLFLELKKKNLRISLAESCTGGLLSDALVSLPGVSEVYPGGLVTYSDELKAELLNVSRTALMKFSAVSAEVARQMALGIKLRTKTDISLSTTGYAGPDGGTEEKPVGTVFISCCYGEEIVTREFHFDGNRARIRRKAVKEALLLALECLKKGE